MSIFDWGNPEINCDARSRTKGGNLPISLPQRESAWYLNEWHEHPRKQSNLLNLDPPALTKSRRFLTSDRQPNSETAGLINDHCGWRGEEPGGF